MKFIKLIIGICLLFVLIPNDTVLAQQQPLYIVIQDEGIMTASPDTNGMVVAKLSKGTRIEFVRQQDEWTKVDYNGRLGWLPSDAILPFTKDLLPVYASYYQLLEKTDHIIYALIADFTQDGVEELYIVRDKDSKKGQYEEYMYSGDQLIYQKNETMGLKVLKNGLNYYLYHHNQINDEKKYKLSQLNDQAKMDYANTQNAEVLANSYVKSYYIITTGDGQLSEQTLTYEQVASKDYTEAEQTNDYGESIYLERYALSKAGTTSMLTEQQFQNELAIYERAKAVKIIYDDQYKSAALNERFTYNSERTKKELVALATSVMPQRTFDMAETELQALQEVIAQSAYLQLPSNLVKERTMLSYFQAVQRGIKQEMTGLNLSQLDMKKHERDITYNRAPIDELIYRFYGVQMEADTFNRLGNDSGYLLTKENYVSNIIEETPNEMPIYRQILGVETVASNYLAVHYQDYELPKNVQLEESELMLAGTPLETGYVLLKRLSFQGGVQFIYIDTVETLAYLNTNYYAAYENTLDIIRKLAAEQKLQAAEGVEQGEIINEENVPALQLPVQQAEEKNTNKFVWLMLGFFVIFVFVVSYYIYQRKYVK